MHDLFIGIFFSLYKNLLNFNIFTAMIKILHTSDWHIGKQLHNFDLSEDLELFFNWLADTIKKENIDVLLVSGDIFDQANPSQAAYKQYYNVLKRLVSLGIKIVITGGNHDSAAALNAPAELLKAFDISVIGGAAELEELFIPIEKNNENIIVAAVPYLRDRDIRKSVAGENYETKVEQLKQGLKSYFASINTHYQENHHDVFFIVMGHLYVQGSQISDSEREIQLGNLAGVEAEMFGGIPNYVALGHIHKPQVISQTHQIHYCGSPIPLSFSEKEDDKQINVLTVENNTLKNLEIIPIPSFRNLLHFEGSLEEVKAKIANYTSETELISLAEVVVNEWDENIEIRYAFEEFVNSDPNPKLEIVKSRLYFINQTKGTASAFDQTTDVSEVTPLQMFEKRLELEGEVSNKKELILAFKEILEELNL